MSDYDDYDEQGLRVVDSTDLIDYFDQPAPAMIGNGKNRATDSLAVDQETLDYQRKNMLDQEGNPLDTVRAMSRVLDEDMVYGTLSDGFDEMYGDADEGIGALFTIAEQ